MPRQIKFRAWNKHILQMRRVDRIFFNENIIQVPYDPFDSNDDHTWDLDYCVLMQFSGLQDKNNIEIYEGDLLKVTYKSLPQQVKFIDKIATFGWDDSGLIFCEANQKEFEIIGNIYQNFEFLGLQI